MRYQRRVALSVFQLRTTPPFLFHQSQLQPNHNRLHCFYSLYSTSPPSSSCGIAFDIDGVILRGRNPIGGSPQALRRLYNFSGSLKVPFLFLTNGGGVPESRRAIDLSEILGVKILASQVLQGHSPFKSLLKRYENELILATGKGEPAVVMSEYGFKKVLSLDEYASLFDNIDPVAQYKRWTTKPQLVGNDLSVNMVPRCDVSLETVKAVFVISDPVDWGRDIQAAFPSERLGMGAFRIALESIFNRVHHNALEYVTYGKPKPFVFRIAEAMLSQQLQTSYTSDNFNEYADSGLHHFKTLYMIGDNPRVDIKGARLAGHPWFSILTRTGVFRGEHNHAEFPADLASCLNSFKDSYHINIYKHNVLNPHHH